MSEFSGKTYLISGGAVRIGAAIAECLHKAGANVIVHYRSSKDAATELVERFNEERKDSALALQADLSDVNATKNLAVRVSHWKDKIDGLINNASSYYATPIAHASEEDWDDLFDSNVKSAFFLTQACLSMLQKANGSVINMGDINTRKPLPDHSIYCASKAALEMITKSLAEELAPLVRVNSIAPGAILWAEHEMEDEEFREERLAGVPLQRKGNPEHIVQAVKYLLQAEYVTGQTIAVDGGLSLR